MRTRRNFHPTLDGMPSRIAPSAVALLPPVPVAVHVGSPMTSGAQVPTGHENDTEGANSGNSTTTIGSPPQSGNGTLLC
jgi:hypothetical protein